MTSDNYNYWEETQYYPICTKCHCKITSTNWCSRECWIKQRYKEDNNYNNYEKKDDFMNYDNYKKTDDFKYKKEYNILMIEPPIDETKIRKQYKKLVLRCHPDKVNGSTDKFIELQDAYNKLLLIC